MEYQSGLPQEDAWQLDNDPEPDDWPKGEKINLGNLEVRYRDGLDLVLKGVSLNIKGGLPVQNQQSCRCNNQD